MDFLPSQDERLKAFLWAVTDFLFAHRSQKCAIRHLDRDALFRYVAFCKLTGRLYVATDDMKIKAVAFAWADFMERVEAKAEYKHAQFEWTHQHPGDCLFIGDVVGTAKFVKRIWTVACAHNPALLACPIYTYRSEKLVRMDVRVIERLCRKEFV